MLPIIQQNADDFLAHKRLALVGLSRNPKDFSRYIYNELRGRGYDMVPVNPNLTEIEGAHCFARLQDVQPPVEGALVMTAADQSESVVHDCAEAGINRVWLHRGAGPGAVAFFKLRSAIGEETAGAPVLLERHHASGRRVDRQRRNLPLRFLDIVQCLVAFLQLALDIGV